MARHANRPKTPPLDLIVWANVIKWKTIRGISDEELAQVLGISSIYGRNKSYLLRTREMGIICEFFQIEPEKLLER